MVLKAVAVTQVQAVRAVAAAEITEIRVLVRVIHLPQARHKAITAVTATANMELVVAAALVPLEQLRLLLLVGEMVAPDLHLLFLVLR